jgi:hypothetical protein
MSDNFKNIDFNIDNIVFHKPKKDKHGVITIDMSHKITNNKLQFYFTRSEGCFFFCYLDVDYIGNNTNTPSQMFPSEEYSPDTNHFLLKLQDFQDKFIDYVINNSEFFSGEKLDPDVIKTMFKPIMYSIREAIIPQQFVLKSH